MSKVYIKPYDPYTISGRDFATLSDRTIRRTVFSPDNQHSVSLMQLRDGCLILSNVSRIPFKFSISRGQKVLIVVKVQPNDNTLQINTNCRLTQTTVENREIHTNPDLVVDPTFNMNFDLSGFCRVDLKVEESGYAACILSEKDLVFVRMNGNHSIPRLENFIEMETKRCVERVIEVEMTRRFQDSARKTQIGKEFIQE